MSQTQILNLDSMVIDPAVINRAAEVLNRGGLVVFPTETVYGIAANLLNKRSIKKLREIKDRSEDKPFSIHVGDKYDVERYAQNILPRAYKMMEHFWPGPLTLILSAPQKKSVGLRFPNNEIAQRLLRRVDFPVVAPSANRAGDEPARDAGSAFMKLKGLVDLILDGGPTELGVESTVLDARSLPFNILREGYLKKDDVMSVASEQTILFVCTGNSCRSVMAEYLLKKKMMDAGRQGVDIYSAGVLAFLGMQPTRETQTLIEEIGLDASAHRASRVSLDLVRRSDLILVMEERHKEALLKSFPKVRNRIHIFGEFIHLDEAEAEVLDPIGKDEEFYRSCFAKLKDMIDRLEI